MITVDLSALEELSAMTNTSASDADDVRSRLRDVIAEMEENVELTQLPQSASALEALDNCVNTMGDLSESMQALRQLMLGAAEEYAENERRFTEELDAMFETLNGIGTALSAAEVADLVVVEKNYDDLCKTQVEKLVAESSSAMEMVNVAAVSKVIDEQYGVTDVKSDVKQLTQDAERQSEQLEGASIAASAVTVDDEDEINTDLKSSVAEMNDSMDEIDLAAFNAQNLKVKDEEEDE